MPCVDDKGSLTPSARKMLGALMSPVTPEEVAERTGLALYRIRSGLREMVQAGLVEAHDGKYVASAKGRSLMAA